MADIIAPSVSNVSPADGAVSVNPTAVFQFDVSDTSGDASSNQIVDTIGDRFSSVNLSGQVGGGGITTFNLGFPFIAGTLEVWVNGIRKNNDTFEVITPHPGSGTFDIAVAPNPGDDVQAAAMPVGATLVNVRLDSVVVRVNGALAFSGGAFATGYSGTIAPLGSGFGGYRFIFTGHPTFPTNTLMTVTVAATDYAGNVMIAFAWTFTILTFTMTNLSPSSVENNGGSLIALLGSFTRLPVTVHLVNMAGGSPVLCYSGQSGRGSSPLPTSAGVVRFATAPVPSGTYKILARQGSVEFDSSAAASPFFLTMVPPNWKSRTFALRRVLPPWYKTGPRNLDSVDLLT